MGAPSCQGDEHIYCGPWGICTYDETSQRTCGAVRCRCRSANDTNDMPSAQCYTVLHIFTETKLSEFDPIRTALYSVPHIHSIPTAHLQQPTACSQYIHSVPQNIHSVPQQQIQLNHDCIRCTLFRYYNLTLNRKLGPHVHLSCTLHLERPLIAPGLSAAAVVQSH